MEFEEGRGVRQAGVVIGFLFSYTLFTTILYFILTYTNSLPPSWIWLHVALITLSITALGLFIEEVLR